MAHGTGGAKIGTKVAGVVSKAIVATHAKLVGTKHRLAMLIFHSISDMISEEVHRSLDRTLVGFYENLPASSPAKPLLNFMANEIGQLHAGAGMSTVAGSLTSSVAQVINNELAPSIRGLLASNPHQLPDVGTVAQMAAQGWSTASNAVDAINQQGIDSGWANAMISMAEQYPAVADALDMQRRGLIDTNTFLEYCQHNGVPADVAAHYGQLLWLPLSVADAALAVLRGSLTMDQGIQIAQENGVLPADFQTMMDNTGEPLALEQLLEAYRRGFINEARLEQGIAESRIRNDWISTAVQLRYSPMSVADAVNAVVQNQMTEADAVSIADQNGLEPGAIQTLFNTAGEPLSRTEMEQLYNRGEATLAQVKQALDESRLKPKYTDLATLLSRRLMTEADIADGVLWGVLSHSDALDRAMELGYNQADANIIVSKAVNQKLQTQRQQVMTSIVAMYEANAMSLDDAQQLASTLGYETSEVDFILQAAEFRRDQKLTAAAMSAVRSKYIAYHITEQEAQADIDAIGVPSNERDQVIQLWTLERQANTKQLTATEVGTAVKLGLLDVNDAVARLVTQGYTTDDATIIANLG